MAIQRLEANAYSTAAVFISNLNSDPEHRIAYLDADESAILGALLDFEPPPDSAVLGFYSPYGYGDATQVNNLRGLIAFEGSPSHKKAWIYGPWVNEPDPRGWQMKAQLLYNQLGLILPSYVITQELHFDRQHRFARTFAALNGFVVSSEDTVYRIARAHAEFAQHDAWHVLAKAHEGALVMLHDRLFPGTYYSGDELLAMRGDDIVILQVVEDGALAGYVTVSRDLEQGEAYIDFIGVEAAERGRGVGSRLLRSAIAWAFDDARVGEMMLTVDSGNPAERLYTRHGFEIKQATRSYRKATA